MLKDALQRLLECGCHTKPEIHGRELAGLSPSASWVSSCC